MRVHTLREAAFIARHVLARVSEFEKLARETSRGITRYLGQEEVIGECVVGSDDARTGDNWLDSRFFYLWLNVFALVQ